MVVFSTDLASRDRSVHADPGGAGGIPYAGAPGTNSVATIPILLTIGLVIDGSELGMAGVPVVVQSASGSVDVVVVTGADGQLSLQLPDVAGLSASLPLNGVFDVPIQAGNPFLIVVP
jgi:hypothetical protein